MNFLLSLLCDYKVDEANVEFLKVCRIIQSMDLSIRSLSKLAIVNHDQRI
jgi:hypothetical protein